MNRYSPAARRIAHKLGGVLIAASLLGTTGCYKATFVEDPRAAKQEPTYDEWTDHYAFGLIGDEQYDTRKWCPEGTGAVRTGGNAGTTTLTILTLGIYAPRKVYVTCDQPQQIAYKTEKKP
jgi:hypothetical protein